MAATTKVWVGYQGAYVPLVDNPLPKWTVAEFQAYLLSTSPTYCWPLQANVNDIVGSWHATNGGGVVFGGRQEPNGVLLADFAGSPTSNLRLPGSHDIGDISIFCVIHPDRAGDNTILADGYQDDGFGDEIGVLLTAGFGDLGAVNTYSFAMHNVPAQWMGLLTGGPATVVSTHTVIAVRQGLQGYLAVNNGTKTAVGSAWGKTPTQFRNVWIGRSYHSGNTNPYADMGLAYLTIWNRALTNTETTDLYNWYQKIGTVK